MISPLPEKRCLQAVMAIACLVPILAGLDGMIEGASMLDGGGRENLDSHFRYLSGLLLGIGASFLLSIPRIEKRGKRIRLLTMVVFIGGMGRLAGMLVGITPDSAMKAALLMELVITPLLCLWQHRVARLLAHGQ